MTDDIGSLRRERDQLAAQVLRLTAELQLDDCLSTTDLPSHMISFARGAITARGITPDGKGGVLIGYASPAVAAAEFVKTKGPELIAAHARSVAGMRARGSEAAREPESGTQERQHVGDATTITRSAFEALAPRDQANAGRRLTRGELKIVDDPG